MRRLFFLLILSCICTGVLSQDGWSTQDYAYATSQTTFKAQRVIPPSPDAAELGKYGNLPVSFFTGTPQISIPLYEIKGSQLSLPLSLSYNASGFKPQDVASWVGLGWTLNAGGVITRSIMGNPDNSSNYFFANNNYQNPPLMTDLLPAYDYMDSITKASKETQPDMYYYNFGGYSGKFIMAPNQSIIRKEKNNLKFSSNGVPTDASASSWFQVVDENGNVYRFDKVEMSMMQQNDAVDQNLPVTLNYVYPSSWYLGSITSADGSEVISFTYYDNPSNQSQYSAYLQNQSYSYYHNPYSTSNTAYEGGNPVNYASPPYVTLSHRRYLQSISLTKGGNTIATVSLGLAANQRQDLDDLTYPGEQMPMNMTISSYKGLVKKYNFYYSYFINSSSPSSPDYKRLRLDSVSEVPVDGSGLYKPPYSFVYDNSPMASQSQSSIDHWGFLNGGTVSTLVPYYTVNDQQYGGGANRNPSLSGSMTAMLTKINYPTGGSTALVYEGHQGFTDVSHTYFDVGGIRIKQMIDYSFPGKQAVVKNYSYVRPDGWGSGVSSIPSSYATFGTFHHYPEPVQGGCSLPQCTKASDYTFQLLTVSASSVAGLGSIAGSHIGYSYVTEYQTDTAGTMLGKTVYHYYTGFMGSKDDDIHSGDLLDKSVYDMFGKLLDKQENTYYLDNGDGALKVYTVTPLPNQDNYYELCKYTSGSNTVYQWKADWATNPVCVQSKLYKTKYIYSFYPIVSNWKQLTQEVHTTYDQLTNGYVVTTKKYTYGSTAHTMPTVIEQYSSSNDEIVTSKKYAGDYTVPGSGLDNASTGLQLLQTKNMLTKEIETVTYRQNQDGSGKRYIDGTLSFYGPFAPYLTSVKRLELSAPVTTLTASTTNGTFTYDAAYKPLASMKYDGSGNLIEQSKDQDMVTSYIWDACGECRYHWRRHIAGAFRLRGNSDH